MEEQQALADLRNAVVSGDMDSTASLAEAALTQGVGAAEILNGVLIPAMDEVGTRYESGELFVPEMLVAAEAMKRALNVLRPLLMEEGIQPEGRVVIGTVEGDLHDIGKDLVAMLLEGAGFEVTNLGVEVTASQFVEAVREYGPDIVAMSALLTTTMIRMPEVVSALTAAGLRDQVRVIVGGAPLSASYAEEIGADGYAPDAASAVKLARRLAVALS